MEAAEVKKLAIGSTHQPAMDFISEQKPPPAPTSRSCLRGRWSLSPRPSRGIVQKALWTSFLKMAYMANLRYSAKRKQSELDMKDSPIKINVCVLIDKLMKKTK
jgi:hypothetical protein